MSPTDTRSHCGEYTRRWAMAPGGWEYVACIHCGHVALANPPDEATLGRYYDNLYGYNDAAFARAVDRRYLPAVLSAVAHYAPHATSLLDIGANTGHLLDGMRRRGWHTGGVELGSQFRDVARRRGLDVRAVLEEWGDEEFDVVTAMHVIEHCRDPEAFLGALRARIAPGGLLLLRTPNAASIPARLVSSHWEWTSPPAHLHLFTPASLYAAVTRTGFDVRAITSARGNAKSTLFELARAGVHALAAYRDRPNRINERPSRIDPPMHRSDRWWYRAASMPFEFAEHFCTPLTRLFGRAGFMPELAVVALKAR